MSAGGHSGSGSGPSSREGASHNEGATQGPRLRISPGRRAEGSAARGSESNRAKREESGTQERNRAEGKRDSSKGQTAGRGATPTATMHAIRRSPARNNAIRARTARGRMDRRTRIGRPVRASPSNQNAAQGQTSTQGQTQSQTTANSQIQTQRGKNVTAQQCTTLQQSVLQVSNVPHVNSSSINFQVRAGIAVPSSVTIASVSTYPALIDVFPAYRDDSFPDADQSPSSC